MDTAVGETPVGLNSSSGGRASGKGWKSIKAPTVRTQQAILKTTKWEERMAKTQKEASIKKLQQDMKDEKQADILRRKQITQDRRRAAEERRAADELKAKVGAKKAARMKKRAGRTKKIAH